jgi:membrane protein
MPPREADNGLTLTNVKPLLSETFSAWSAHEGPRLGAALSFYGVLSLAPLVILVVSIVALVFGESSAQAQIVAQVQGLIGKDGADVIQNMLKNARDPGPGVTGFLVSIVTVLFGASGVFTELRAALNKIWEVQPATAAGFMGMIKDRIFSFGMVLAIGFLLLVSLILSATLAAAGKFFGGLLPLPEFALSAINFVVSFGGIVILFALIFRYVPETKIPWRSIWLGSAATALLFTVGKYLIGLYLGKAAVGSAYGAAGSIIVVIVWVYYSSMIFYFGAEFTRVITRSSPGRAYHPVPGAAYSGT